VNGFDRFPDEAPVSSGTDITDAYGKQGVVLENARAFDASLYADLPAESAPNILLTSGASPRSGTILARFVRPSDGSSPGTTQRVGVVFIDVDDPDEKARLEVYDENDQPLQIIHVPVAGDGSRQYVEVESQGISYVRCVLSEAGDGCAIDDLTYAVVPIEMYILAGYPAQDQETDLVEGYLRTEQSGKDEDVFYVSHPGKKRYLHLRMGSTPEAFAHALQRPGACVGFTGHSNFGLGSLFSDLPDHSHIEWVNSVADFMNVSSTLVGASWPYLVHEQAYPNLWFPDDEIAAYPENYCTPVGLQRFPNDDGVGICEAFGEVQGEGIDRFHYRLTDLVGDAFRLVVRGGDADLPDPLRYAVLYYRSCNSGAYYSESFNRGVYFYTTLDSVIGAQDIFVKGILYDIEWNALKVRLNQRQNNNDYFDFTQWAPFDRCDPNCE